MSCQFKYSKILDQHLTVISKNSGITWFFFHLNLRVDRKWALTKFEVLSFSPTEEHFISLRHITTLISWKSSSAAKLLETTHKPSVSHFSHYLTKHQFFKPALLCVGLKIISCPLSLPVASVQPFVNRKDTGKNSPGNCHQKKCTLNISLNTQYFCKSHRQSYSSEPKLRATHNQQ